MMNNSSGPQPQIIRPREPQPSTHPGETSSTTPRRHANARPNLQTPPPKPPVEKKLPPKGVLLPRTGMPAYIYRWRCKHNHADRVPTPNKNDQIDALERELRYYVEQMQITVSFANFKGGASKTTTAVYVGSIIANLTRRVVCALPATQNTGTSTLAFNAGIVGKTLSVSEFSRDYRLYGSFRDTSAKVKRNAFGLMVLGEDTVESANIKNKFGYQEFLDTIDTLHDNVDAMLLDTGNDEIDQESVVLEAIRRSDVIVFTATADNLATLNKLTSTFATYLTDLSNDRNKYNGPRAEGEIPTSEKTAQSVVVISGVKPGVKTSKYNEYVMRRNKSGNLESIGFEGKLLTVPLDLYLRQNTTVDIRKNKISRLTYCAYLEVAIAIYKQAAVLRNFNLEFDPNADL